MVKDKRTAPKDIDEYIAGFPSDVRPILEKVRATIRKAAPQAQEKIGYGIPTFTLSGNLVHFAGYEKHIGFYPAASGIAKFKRELSGFKSAKGSVQFPLGEPVPYGLIGKIVKFRVAENSGKTVRARKKK
jgi:uncharacterized protein YdhG (YjbR/CyaY superfamily)